MAMQNDDMADDKRADSVGSKNQENKDTMAPFPRAPGAPPNVTNIVAGIKISEREKEVIVLTYKCLKKTPDIDFEELAKLGGFKSKKSAADCWRATFSKLTGGIKPEDRVASAIDEAQPATKPARGKTSAGPRKKAPAVEGKDAKPETKPKSRKRKAEPETEQNNEVENTDVKQNGAKPKKAGRAAKVAAGPKAKKMKSAPVAETSGESELSSLDSNDMPSSPPMMPLPVGGNPDINEHLPGKDTKDGSADAAEEEESVENDDADAIKKTKTVSAKKSVGSNAKTAKTGKAKADMKITKAASKPKAAAKPKAAVKPKATPKPEADPKSVDEPKTKAVAEEQEVEGALVEGGVVESIEPNESNTAYVVDEDMKDVEAPTAAENEAGVV